MSRLIPTAVVLSLVLPALGIAQEGGGSGDLLDSIRADVFVEMIASRAYPGRAVLCLGLGGETTPLEDPSDRVLSAVRARETEYRLVDGSPQEVRAFSACEEASLEETAPPDERAQAFLITALWMTDGGRSAHSQGHAGLDRGEVFDCVVRVEEGQREIERCGVLHEHVGAFRIKRREGAGGRGLE